MGDRLSSAREEADPITRWLADLEARHLADLSRSEVARALRALSALYVERRGRLAGGAALDGRGKRAAFALFYAPLHFLTIQRILAELPGSDEASDLLVDLGCGTGVAGAAWALHATTRRIAGIDRHAWAAAEAEGTYRSLGVRGRASTGNLVRARLPAAAGGAIVAAYAVNELPPDQRDALLDRVATAIESGVRVLVVEPIARRALPWWGRWVEAFTSRGGRDDEWRFQAALPALQRDLGRAAGLDPRELTARSLYA